MAYILLQQLNNRNSDPNLRPSQPPTTGEAIVLLAILGIGLTLIVGTFVDFIFARNAYVHATVMAMEDYKVKGSERCRIISDVDGKEAEVTQSGLCAYQPIRVNDDITLQRKTTFITRHVLYSLPDSY